ncbi:hypothetical protein [Sphingobium lactosutens]|uniref:hypothetical protein n=1 Tax=Sphingobium lactosutens TaxID=522773 RepID=UPI00126891FD|nr:hypothetical protein [Sphingobium lactosutens]
MVDGEMKKTLLALVGLYAALVGFGLWKSLTATSYYGSGFLFNFTFPFYLINEYALRIFFSQSYFDMFLGHVHRPYLAAHAALAILDFCIIAYAVFIFLRLSRQKRDNNV